MPARRAFPLGRIMVVPSRAESLPYIVLEVAGAGLPLIASNVGGIPEIFGTDSSRLVPSGDARALASAIATALDHPQDSRQSAESLRDRVREAFSVRLMVDQIVAAYRQALAAA
jgi:glycosyltransferase involved in cell wall biosynthesis